MKALTHLSFLFDLTLILILFHLPLCTQEPGPEFRAEKVLGSITNEVKHKLVAYCSSKELSIPILPLNASLLVTKFPIGNSGTFHQLSRS